MYSFFQRYKLHYRENLNLAIPVVISQVGHTLVQTSDIIIIGHFAGTISLAAVSLANSIFVIGLVIGLGVSYGITPLIAQNNGRKDYLVCGQLLSSSLFINIATGIILFCLTIFGSMTLLGQLHQAQAVVQESKSLLMLLGISILPMLVFNTFRQFAQGLGFTKEAMKITIWGNLINIFLGVIFVKGLFGIAPMGIRGVGYSTLIDRILMAIAMGFYVFKSDNFKAYLKGYKLFDISLVRCKEILKIGVPVAMQYVFEITAFSITAVMVGTIGYHEQAAHQIALNLATITYMISNGISSAAAIKSGNYFGRKDFDGLRESAIASYHLVCVMMIITALIFTVGNHILPFIYTSDKVVVQIAAKLLIIAAIFQLFDGVAVVGLGILNGTGDVKIPTMILFFAYWIIALPAGYLFGIRCHLGASGVWYGLVLGLMTASLLLFARFRFGNKKSINHLGAIALNM